MTARASTIMAALSIHGASVIVRRRRPFSYQWLNLSVLIDIFRLKSHHELVTEGARVRRVANLLRVPSPDRRP
jgi:hypothetical protein